MCGSATMSEVSRILVIRLGAMGDIFHTMPAVAALRASYPTAKITWIVESKWQSLLAGCPFVDEVLALDRSNIAGLASAWSDLRSRRFSLAVDFQGLIKSGLIALASGADTRLGYERSQLRESLASIFYSASKPVDAVHVVDRHRQLVSAVSPVEFYLPPGAAEAPLPVGPYVLTCPMAGWGAKQWPKEYYVELARGVAEQLGMPLVVNGPPGTMFSHFKPAFVHLSGLPGLMEATRRATAVVGLDSGPLHMAAAIQKPGVAIFGPTDPARNGPYGGTLRVLRSAKAATSYKRENVEHAAMRSITPRMVLDELKLCLAKQIEA